MVSLSGRGVTAAVLDTELMLLIPDLAFGAQVIEKSERWTFREARRLRLCGGS